MQPLLLVERNGGQWSAEHEGQATTTTRRLADLCATAAPLLGGRTRPVCEELEVILKPNALPGAVDEETVIDVISLGEGGELVVTHDRSRDHPVSLCQVAYVGEDVLCTRLALPFDALIQAVPSLGAAARRESLRRTIKACGPSMTGREYATAAAGWPPEAWKGSQGLMSGWQTAQP